MQFEGPLPRFWCNFLPFSYPLLNPPPLIVIFFIFFPSDQPSSQHQSILHDIYPWTNEKRNCLSGSLGWDRVYPPQKCTAPKINIFKENSRLLISHCTSQGRCVYFLLGCTGYPAFFDIRSDIRFHSPDIRLVGLPDILLKNCLKSK